MNDKFVKVIGSFGISAAIVELIVPLVFMGAEPLVLIASMVGGTIGVWPVTYMITNKMSKSAREREEKELRCVATTFAMLAEENSEKDKTYGKTTTNFTKKITIKEQEMGIKYTPELEININSLIYLINSNYYQEIAAYIPRLNREQLIDMLLQQIFTVLGDTDASQLKNKDVKKILKGCYFIKDELKEQISQEYKESEVNFSGFIDHSIVNKNIDIMDEEEYKTAKKLEIPETSCFNINNIKDIKIIIEGLTVADNYLCNYGDVTKIRWDENALQEVVCIIAQSFREKLVEQIPNYTEFDLTTSLAHNAMAYAVFNNKEEISYKELIKTFKEWTYIPYELRCYIVEHLINKLEMNEEEYPLNIKKGTPKKAKIIQFKPVK